MARTAYSRNQYSGGGIQTTISSGINASVQTISLTAATGWPDLTTGGMFAVIDETLSTEEKVYIPSGGLSGVTLTNVVRGVDNTSGATHASAATIRPCAPSIDFNEANLLVSKMLLLATAQGQVPVVDAANSFAMVQAKTSGQILVGSGTTLASVAVSGDATLAASGAVTIAALAVTNAKLAAMVRGTLKYGTSGGAAGDLAIGGANTVLATDGTDPSWRKVVSADITDGTIATADIANLAITTGLLAANAATNAKLAGMTRGTVKVGDSGGAASDLALGASATTLMSDGTDAKWVAHSGDVTISSTGVTAIGSGKVTSTMVADGTLTVADHSTSGVLVQYIPFSTAGNLATGTGALGFRCPVAMTIKHVRLNVGTAPTGTTSTPIAGQSLVIDINKNGTTVFTTQANRPTIAASATTETATTAPDVTALAAGDVVTMDVDFVGSTVVGANLVAVVYLVLA